ncbi:cell division protein ZapA [Porphyrobacter sp. GA68]|uniref:cell division protein ZapA n=1 Tax=Porphyrobacter sp. GA68 TaxID=2883480 RepID=UPI001D180321|nr:cell division protein ZapA [Porphyrobacter sp. GA68]
MSEVTLEIARRTYTLRCDPGQEDHVRSLGDEVDARLRRLGANLSLNDAKNMLFAALMLADELQELRLQAGAAGMDEVADGSDTRIAELEERLSEAEDETERLRLHLANANARLKESSALEAASSSTEREDEVADQIEGLAEKLERCALLLESARGAH